MNEFEGTERMWTPPSYWCPAPEYWHSPDDESTEIEVLQLVFGFVRALQPEFVLETGTAFGHGTSIMADAILFNGHGKLVSIEIDEQRVNDARKLFMTRDQVEIVHGSSLDYVPPRTIDFAWLDSGPIRDQEFEHFYPWFSERTVVGIHDTGPQHVVRASLEPLIARGIFKPIFLYTPRGVCFGEVVK